MGAEKDVKETYGSPVKLGRTPVILSFGIVKKSAVGKHTKFEAR